MITSCPECKTRFRATPEQLAVRQGLVRCGKCKHIFNAFAYAQKEAAFQTKETVMPTPLELDKFDKLQGHINEFPQKVSWIQKTQVEPQVEKEKEKEATPMTDKTSMSATSEHQGKCLDNTDKHSTLQLPHNDSALWKYQPPVYLAPKKNTIGLFILLFLIIALFVQTAYLWRTETVTYFPQTKPTFETICRNLGCTIPLFKEINSIKIEASNMETDVKRTNVILLNAVLRNHSHLLLAYPLIEITLTDNFDRAIARQSLDVSEYATQSAKGFAPDTELVTHMALETTTLKPAGYRLRLYYR